MVEATFEQEAKELQPKFVALLEKLHRLGYESFGPNGRFSQPDVNNDALSALADATITEFSTLYSKLPEGHHLEIGLPPARYRELAGHSDLQLLCHTDMTESGPQYWLSVAQHVDSFKGISPGRSVLNILPIGTNDEKNPAARLDLAMISSQGQKALGVGMYPEEMLALRIVPNGLPKVK